jgi:hypothetical protein
MARLQDPTLNRVLEGVDARNLGAAALLLAVNELRTHIDTQQPFKEDLALVEKIAGADPAMHKALSNLAPYAESGVLSRQSLQREFKGLAGDIVMAKFSGEDASVKTRALQRLSKLVKVRRIDDVKGDGPDAVVARAQLLLDKNDVRGAMAELKKLEGPPAETAGPWLEAAGGHVAAAESSGALSQMILQILSSSASGGGFSLDGVVSSLKDTLGGVAGGGEGEGAVPYLSPSMQAQETPGSLPPYQEK